MSNSSAGINLTAPDNNEQNLALDRKHWFAGPLAAEFGFQWQYFFTTAGFVFGAKNASSFSQLDFP